MEVVLERSQRYYFNNTLNIFIRFTDLIAFVTFIITYKTNIYSLIYFHIGINEKV